MAQPENASLVAALVKVVAILAVYPIINTEQSKALKPQAAYKWVEKHRDWEIRKEINRLTPQRPAPPAPIKRAGTW